MVKGARKSNGETAVEARIVRVFLRSVGAGCGLYNPHTKEFKEGLESEPLYQSNLEIVRDALKNGWVAADLEEFIIRRWRLGEKAALLAEILTKPESKRIDEQDNLIEEGESYYHPALFTRTAPSYAVSNGAMVPVTRGTVAPKESFTLMDLVSHFFRHSRRADTPRQRSTAINQMRWLLSQATLDEILFAIDLAEETETEVGVFDLTEHLDEARQQVFICQARSTE